MSGILMYCLLLVPLPPPAPLAFPTPASPPPIIASTPAAAQLTDEAIDGAGDSVMGANEFRSVRRRVLEQIPESDADRGFLRDVMEYTGRAVDWVFSAIGGFFRWIGQLLTFDSARKNASPAPQSEDVSLLAAGMTGLTKLLAILAIVGILLVVMVIVSMILKSAERKRRLADGLLLDGEENPAALSTPPGELAAATYEVRAIQLAAEGNYRAAIRELLLGSMSWIERAGLIRYRRGLTNRDYVRAVWRRTPKRDAYAVTALEFERVYFGRRTATVDVFETCLNSFRGAFREEEKPAAAV